MDPRKEAGTTLNSREESLSYPSALMFISEPFIMWELTKSERTALWKFWQALDPRSPALLWICFPTPSTNKA